MFYFGRAVKIMKDTYKDWQIKTINCGNNKIVTRERQEGRLNEAEWTSK